jgi:hypothetical protein
MLRFLASPTIDLASAHAVVLTTLDKWRTKVQMHLKLDIDPCCVLETMCGRVALEMEIPHDAPMILANGVERRSREVSGDLYAPSLRLECSLCYLETLLQLYRCMC